MNIEALKTNPMFSPSFMRQVEQQKSADSANSVEASSSVGYGPKPVNSSDFVQKIKGTNEAAGFISVASKGVEALKIALQTSDANNIMDTAQKINFGGRGIMEPQAFDTTAGIVTIDLGLNIQNTDLHSADGKEALLDKLNSAGETLANAKKALSAPVNRGEREQSAKLQTMNTSGSEFLTKLNSAIDRQNTPAPAPRGLDALEAKLNEIGNQIF